MTAQPATPAMPDQTPTPVAAMPPLAPPTYVTPEDVDLARNLPAWPVPGTLASEADVLTILAIQARRTPAETADAQADSTTTMSDFTRALLGPAATPERHPRLFAMMAALHQDMRRINRAANEAQGIRPRPVLFDSRVRPSIDMAGHGGASYPSARASSGHVWAGVIAQLLPERAAEAAAEAERIGWRRVVGGVHYPSDLAGSRHVARAVLAALARSPRFQADLAAVRQELAEQR
jgi:acid phosphatase (class A)